MCEVVNCKQYRQLRPLSHPKLQTKSGQERQ